LFLLLEEKVNRTSFESFIKLLQLAGCQFLKEVHCCTFLFSERKKNYFYLFGSFSSYSLGTAELYKNGVYLESLSVGLSCSLFPLLLLLSMPSVPMLEVTKSLLCSDVLAMLVWRWEMLAWRSELLAWRSELLAWRSELLVWRFEELPWRSDVGSRRLIVIEDIFVGVWFFWQTKIITK